MGFAKETGYTLPGSDLPLTHARVLHAGNMLRTRSIVASSAIAANPVSRVGNALTHERWKPFENQLVNPSNFAAAWTLDGVTVASDGMTLLEDTSTGAHSIEQAYTFTAEETILAVRVALTDGGRYVVRVRADDGSTVATCTADLSDLTTTDVNGAGDVIDMGGGEYLVRMYWTPAAAAGDVQVLLLNDAGAASYAGDDTQGLRIMEAILHPSVATVTLTGYGSAAQTMFALAAHNLWSCGARVSFRHDSNADDTFTDIDAVTPSNDAAIMFLFEEVTSASWQVEVSRGALPEVGVVRVGSPLQMQRPIHQGMRPFETNRATKTRGNMSEGGEWVGRSKIRTALKGSLNWSRFTKAWADANLEGPGNMIQAIEDEPFFIAWRPDTYPVAHYCWTPSEVGGPTFSVAPNLMAWGFPVTAHGYE